MRFSTTGVVAVLLPVQVSQGDEPGAAGGLETVSGRPEAFRTSGGRAARSFNRVGKNEGYCCSTKLYVITPCTFTG